MGMVHLATLSTGRFIEPLNSFKKHEDRLLKAQAGFALQAEVEQELEEGESQGPAHVRPHSQRSSGLSAEDFYRYQPKTTRWLSWRIFRSATFPDLRLALSSNPERR